MHELLWLDHLPHGSIDGGVALANALDWHISVSDGGQPWCVFSGEKPVFCADSRAAIDAFLYGLGLAYAVLPEPVFANLQADVQRWVA